MKKINQYLAGGLLGAVASLSSFQATAQVVKHEKLLSFEEAVVPDFISGSKSTFGISDEHYKDGKQSIWWQFEPGAVMSIKKDLWRKTRKW